MRDDDRDEQPFLVEECAWLRTENWDDYEQDPTGPEGAQYPDPGSDAAKHEPNSYGTPFRIICANCGIRAGMHYGRGGMQCNKGNEPLTTTFVPKRKT